MDKKKTIDIEKIKDPKVDKYEKMYRRARDTHDRRTKHHEFFSSIAHMENIYDADSIVFSEGSTQAIKRKIMAQTLQRVPDGEIITQHNKNSIEQVEIDYIFKNKILTSEIHGKDHFKNL